MMGRWSRRVPTFFETAEAFAGWLEKHGAAESELIVGYYKRGTMSWPESVDAALCFGWIDGVRNRAVIDISSFGEASVPSAPRRAVAAWRHSLRRRKKIGVYDRETCVTCY
jgi:hypothetical protein